MKVKRTAIGKKGQNVRLAARLTGYKIDIRPESEVEFVDENSSDSDSEDAADESQESATNEETASNDAEAADTDNTDTTEDNTEE